MVDITQCAVCGRTIPATLDGCAYCDSEEEAGGQRQDYTPMLLRWLFVLFVLATLLTAILALGSLGRASASSSPLLGSILAGMRLVVSALAGIGVARRSSWAFRAALFFVLVEIVAGGLHASGALPADVWAGRAITPLGSVLFAVFFLRSDVREHFDRGSRDRHRVDALLRSLDSRPDGDQSERPNRS